MGQWELLTLGGFAGRTQDWVLYVAPSASFGGSLKDYLKAYNLKDKVNPSIFAFASHLLENNWEPMTVGTNEVGNTTTLAFRRKISD